MTLKAFRDLGFEFSRAVFGLQQRTPRWKSCTVNVNANFGVALSYLYVKRHFDQTSRQKVSGRFIKYIYLENSIIIRFCEFDFIIF